MNIGNFLVERLNPGIRGALGDMGVMSLDQEAAAATRQQDAMARQNGFRNYDEMLLWARQRQAPRQQTTGSGPMGVVQGAVQDPQGTADKAMAMHPRNMFNRILDAWKGATGQ